MVHLTHVNYKTGLVYDMNAITKAAHAAGYRLTRLTVLDDMRDARERAGKKR